MFGKKQVRQFHSVGLAHGGTNEDPPGIRELYGPSFYVAYLRDPDGHKLACVFAHFDSVVTTAREQDE